MDAATAVRRAALQGHERELERVAGDGRSRYIEGAGEYCGSRIRQVEGRNEGVAVVFGVCLGARYFWAGQQSAALQHLESRRRERWRQPLRIAIQFSGRVCHGIPAASV